MKIWPVNTGLSKKVSSMINESSNSDIASIDSSQEPRVILPSYVDIEQISRLVRVDEKEGKEMWDLMFKVVHRYNKAQVEKEFPTREHPF